MPLCDSHSTRWCVWLWWLLLKCRLQRTVKDTYSEHKICEKSLHHGHQHQRACRSLQQQRMQQQQQQQQPLLQIYGHMGHEHCKNCSTQRFRVSNPNMSLPDFERVEKLLRAGSVLCGLSLIPRFVYPHFCDLSNV